MTIIVSSDKYQVAVSGDEGTLRQIIDSDFGPKYIPAYSVDVSQSSTGLLSLELVQGGKLNFSFNYPNARLTYSSMHEVSIRDLISVIDYCLDYERQKKGTYIVHGSACSKDGKGVLFFGPVSGLGKTSLVLDLCSNKGFEFIGDEKILLSGDGITTGGATTIEFNKQVLHHVADQRLHNYDAKSNNIITLAQGPIEVALYVQPIVVPGAQLIVEEWTRERANWHLYEELTRKIRGISRRIANFSYALPCIDDDYLATRRIRAVEEITSKSMFYSLRGSKELVANELIKLTEIRKVKRGNLLEALPIKPKLITLKNSKFPDNIVHEINL